MSSPRATGLGRPVRAGMGSGIATLAAEAGVQGHATVLVKTSRRKFARNKSHEAAYWPGQEKAPGHLREAGLTTLLAQPGHRWSIMATVQLCDGGRIPHLHRPQQHSSECPGEEWAACDEEELGRCGQAGCESDQCRAEG
jgi:hypothetical protein